MLKVSRAKIYLHKLACAAKMVKYSRAMNKLAQLMRKEARTPSATSSITSVSGSPNGTSVTAAPGTGGYSNPLTSRGVSSAVNKQPGSGTKFNATGQSFASNPAFGSGAGYQSFASSNSAPGNMAGYQTPQTQAGRLSGNASSPEVWMPPQTPPRTAPYTMEEMGLDPNEPFLPDPEEWMPDIERGPEGLKITYPPAAKKYLKSHPPVFNSNVTPQTWQEYSGAPQSGNTGRSRGGRRVQSGGTGQPGLGQQGQYAEGQTGLPQNQSGSGRQLQSGVAQAGNTGQQAGATQSQPAMYGNLTRAQIAQIGGPQAQFDRLEGWELVDAMLMNAKAGWKSSPLAGKNFEYNLNALAKMREEEVYSRKELTSAQKNALEEGHFNMLLEMMPRQARKYCEEHGIQLTPDQNAIIDRALQEIAARQADAEARRQANGSASGYGYGQYSQEQVESDPGPVHENQFRWNGHDVRNPNSVRRGTLY